MARKAILNIAVDDLTMVEFLQAFQTGMLVTPNADHLVLLQSDRRFWEAYSRAEFVTVDSQIVKWALGFLGSPVRARLSGSDVVPAFCDFHHANESIKLFLLGGKEGTAERAARRINAKCGRSIVVGWLSPSMDFVNRRDEIDHAIQMIGASGANVLVVGLGAPKQEIWIDEYRQQMPSISRFMAVGATLDFEAGQIRRAPAVIGSIGLEWLFRLLLEPRRLWRRYLVRDPLFLVLVVRQRLGLYRNPFAMPGG